MAKNRTIPFGYCMKNGEITTDPKEVYAVVTIFNEYLNGKSLVEIAKLMETEKIRYSEDSEHPVLIWEIDGRDEHSLDRYEGFPNLYRKELFDIEVNSEMKECMAYLMNKGQISPPTSYYNNVIKQGYEANGMDTSYLRAALERSVCSQHFDDE